MTKFINQQEEVIQIELTNYGKSLFSRGKFNPTYYAFYDNDILYDGSYGGNAEIQNSIVPRIKDTQRLGNFSSTKTTFPSNQETMSITLGATEFDQITPAASQYLKPLGMSSPFSDYAPAWNVTVLTPDSGLTGSVTYAHNTNIPALSASLDVGYTRGGGEVYQVDDQFFTRNGALTLDKNETIILDVLELNAIFKVNGNYDIEVFKRPKSSNTEAAGDWDRLFFADSSKPLDSSIVPEDFRVPYSLQGSDLANQFGASDAELEQQYRGQSTEDVSYYLDIAVDTAISITPPARTKAFYRNTIGDNNPVSSCND